MSQTTLGDASTAELKQIDIDDLRLTELRDVRSSVVDEIKERIETSGYNPARPLRVVPDGDEYAVADGNHRLKALQELGVRDTVPCVVEPNRDLLAVAVESNQDEDTYAEPDLFDELDYIKRDKEQGLTIKEIAAKVDGWSESYVKQRSAVLSNVVTRVRQMARGAKRRLETDKVTNVTFTEGWFRNSGIYELDAEHQERLMRWFCEQKNCNTSQNQVQKKADELRTIQEQLEILAETLNPDVADEDQVALENSVRDGEHTEQSLRDAIQTLNSEAKSQAHFGHDAIQKLPDIPDNSIDCVVMDPPYGTDYTSHRETENPEFGQGLDSTLALLRDVFDELQRVCKANAHLYMFFSMNRYEDVVPLAREYFGVTDIPLVWAKNNHAPTRDAESGFDKMYAHKYEPILVCRMPNGDTRELNGGACPNVLEHPVPKGDDRWHDSQKPISLLEELIRNSTGAKETVLDPFAGSGSTLLAAKKADRHYLGIEADDSHESRFKKEIRKYE